MLASVGVDVAAFSGSRVARCPVCSNQRKKKLDKCLSVRVDAHGYVFRCHHCRWKGGSARHTAAAHRASPTPRRDDQAAKIETALRIWDASDDPRGTAIERYLASRGLPLLDEIAGEVLRFCPSLYFDGRIVPGMVALLRDIETDIGCGIIRTFFDEHGQKITRRMLGRAHGATVKLDTDAHVAEGLHVCEGVETGIAAMIAGYRPVWALGSAGAIGKFPVFDGIEALTILGERGDANAQAVEEVSARWHNADREVLIVEMLVGDDLNDAWCR
ncbi:toprim domain-containing protein [Bradyrhizobium sp. TZ2]